MAGLRGLGALRHSPPGILVAFDLFFGAGRRFAQFHGFGAEGIRIVTLGFEISRQRHLELLLGPVLLLRRLLFSDGGAAGVSSGFSSRPETTWASFLKSLSPSVFGMCSVLPLSGTGWAAC